MNGLLDSARTIVADLVRKRLWPIAVLLLVALVAIPLLIGASSSAPAPPPGDGAVASVAPSSAADVAVQEAATTTRERAGKVRDPFFDPPPAPSDDAGATTQSEGPSAATSPTAAADPSDAKPSGAKQSDAKPSPAADAKPSSPAAKAPAAPAQTARFGAYYLTAARLAAGATIRPLARLTPIGTPARPAAIYLGVMKVGRPYAVFVLGRRTTSRGEATCAAETACQIIGLRPGDTQTVTVHTADGDVARRYVLRVSSVKRIITSAANARAQRARVHPDGRDAARAMSRDAAVAAALRRVGYRRSTGLLFSEAANVLEQSAR